MGFMDRLLGRNKDGASDDNNNRREANSTPVPLSTFRQFQEQVNEGMRDMRGKYSELVEENHGLKKQLISVTERLDELQRTQLEMRAETKRSLTEIKTMAQKGGMTDESMRQNLSSSNPEEDMMQKRAAQANQSLASLTGRLASPGLESKGLKPS